jgi:hypothetical protein
VLSPKRVWSAGRASHLVFARSESQIVRLSDPPPLVSREFGDGSQIPGGDLNGGVYRASHIVLYSSFTGAEPPTRALTNEWDDPGFARARDTSWA